jgi:5-epi-alpha-selinene synthase
MIIMILEERTISHYSDFENKEEKRSELFKQVSIFPIIKSKNKELEELKKLMIETIKQNPLSNPFPLKFNQYAEEADKRTIEWVQKFKLIPEGPAFEKFLKAKYINLTAGAYPNCSLEKLILCSQWILFLYLNDDAVEEMAVKNLEALNKRNIKILKDKSKPNEKDGSLTHAVYDLMTRIRKVANKEWINYFLKKVEQHFQSTVWEAKNREQGISIPDYEIYIKMRFYTGAVDTVLALNELEIDVPLPLKKLKIPRKIFKKHLEELNVRCNNIICWSNDIKSSQKELDGYFINNLVFVIKHEFTCSLEEAIKRSITLHNNEVNRFETLKDNLYAQLEKTEKSDLKKYTADIGEYVEGMRYWMGSHFNFAENSRRYNEHK